MIHIILYYILSVANAPTFIWVAFWLHLVVGVFMFLAGVSNRISQKTINLNNIGEDEEF